MAKFNVHVGCRYTNDYIIEAENESEAIMLAENIVMNESTSEIVNWKFADDDYDCWEIKGE